MVARAFYLNFDAEAELADPSARTSSRAVIERARALAEKVRALLLPGDVVVWDGDVLPRGAYSGRAWCPTPRALAALARAGARVPAAPSFEILRRVNHRRFAADLGQTLEGAIYVNTRTGLARVLAARPRGEAWVLKRPFGFAGRARLRIRAGAIDEREERWIAASLATGEGLQAEPWVDRTADFGLHGFLSRAGELTLGEPTAQRCDAAGAWIASEPAPAGALADHERAALVHAAEESAAALAAAGYFGPFGVDAFRYTDARGQARFDPRCEINARYSMGWAVGMGERRPDLDDP
jgi:hypothetical protein